MDGLQTTTGADVTTIDLELDVFGDTEDQEVKDANKKDRKELFQINTHPATIVAANNKRDRRLKKIVMRVVAFCKKEHEEGQQVPFRFFKKRASLMTGVSLSTIHRIETIDMKAPPPTEAPSKGKPKKDGQKKKKKKKKGSGEGAAPRVMLTSGGPESVCVNVTPVSLVQHSVSQGGGHRHHLNSQHLHFQIPAAAMSVNPTLAVTESKPAKKKKKKMKKEKDDVSTSSSMMATPHRHNPNTTTLPPTTILTSDMALQPTVAVHAVNTLGMGVGEGVVTALSVHNPMGGGTNPVVALQQRATPWAGSLGTFTVGELREGGGHQVQLSAAAALSPLQVSSQQLMGSTIPVNPTQLQTLPVAAAVSQHAGFTPGQIDSGQVTHWAGGMGVAAATFGTLPTTVPLVGQQVLQTCAYPNPGPTLHSNPTNPVTHTLTVANPQQQQSIFYQF